MGDLQSETEDISAIEGWSKDEKYYLLQAIKTFGSYDVEKIQDYVTTKSIEQVEAAIEYYKKQALKHPIFVKKHAPTLAKTFPHKPRVPLTSWAKLLTDNMTYEDLCTETSSAIKIIADLEKKSSPVCTENIDFRKIYHQIASAMEGKMIVPDKLSTAILHKCIVETALASKAFIKTSAYKYILNSFDLSEQETSVFPRLTENPELTVLRHLASQRSYNPLKIPEEYLKPSCDSVLEKKEPET